MIPVVAQLCDSFFGFPVRQTRRSKCHSVLVLAAAVLLAAVGALQTEAQSARQALHNHVRAEVADHKALFVSRMAADQQLTMSIVLPLRNEDALTSLLARLYDPASADYRKFLSVDQFTDQFGPTKDDYDAVVAYAIANGLTVTGSPVNRLIVPVTGTVEQVNTAFNVQMSVYQHPTEKRTFFSADREPSLDLSVPIADISGLDSFSLPRHFARRPQDGQANAVLGSGPGNSYLGSDMRAAYYGGTALTGGSQAVGLLEFGGYLKSDVDLTFSNAGQTYSVPVNNVLLDGATGAPSGSDGEEVLDIVQAIGMAPALSQVRVYIGYGLDDPSILNSMASENIAKQLSCSWGWRPADPTADDPFFMEMAAQGQSFFTASGDYGAFDAAVNPFFFPAEDMYVTTVGGTHLATTGAAGPWSSETAWNSQGDGSGGGISPDNIPIPSWQSGLASTANGGSNTLRNVPDIAMEGDFDNYACALGQCAGDWAGTSFAAPRWAAFMALVNQQAVEAGNAPTGGIGFINPQLYLLAQSTKSSSVLHDIVSGNNDTANQPTWFSAVPGYDLVAGWGSPTGQNLIDALAGPAVPGFFLGGSASVIAVNPGGSGSNTLTITDVAGFTDSVNLAVTSALPAGVQASFSPNPSKDSSVLTFTASSTAAQANTQVTVTGTSGNVSASTNFTLAVHAPTFALTASPTTLGVNQGASGTANITVVPQYGFSDVVTLVASGLPSGVTASFSPATTSGSSTLTLSVSSTATPGTSTVTISGGSGSLSASATISLSIHGPSFTLTSYGPISLGQGATTTTYVYVTDLYGFSGSVNLAASGLPSGVTASFSPNPATGTSTMTLMASSAAAIGQSTVTVTGTSGSLTASTNFTLNILTPTYTLSTSTSVNVGQGSSATGYVYVNPQYGFTGSVNLSFSGLPSGVTALFSPNPTTGSSNFTLVASSSAKAGQYNVTLTGTSGTQMASSTLTVGVYAPTFTLSGSTSVNIGQGTTSTAYVYVTPQYGFTGSVTLAVSGLPSGVTGTFSPNPTTGSSTLTLVASSAAAIGQYTATITGTSGSQTLSYTMSVGVFAPTFTLSSYGAINVGRGTSSTGYVYVNPQYGFTGSVNFGISGLPAGVTASFSPNPSTGSSLLTLTASGTATLGQYTATITGTSGTQTATTTVTVGVYTPTFSLYGSSSVTLGQGTTTTSYVYVTQQYGFTGSVNFSISGLPAGVTASFSPNPGTTSTTLTLTASSTAALGQYTATITGMSGTQTATMPVTLGVYTPTFTLSSYGPVSLGQGASTTSYVYVNTQYGFSGSVNLSVSGLPAGVTASFSPNPTTYSSTLTLTASSAAAIGSSTLTITGSAAGQTVTCTLVVNIYAPSFTLSSNVYPSNFNPGSSTSGSIYISDLYGFSSGVMLTTSGLPSGVTALFSPNPSTSTQSAMTLTASSAAVPGTYNVTVTGTSGTLTSSTTFQITINTPGFILSTAPAKVMVVLGGSARAGVTVAAVNGFNSSVSLAATGLPSGVTAAFSPASTTTTSTLTLTATSAAVPGSSTVTITGTYAGVSSSTSLNLTVANAPNATTITLALTAGGSAAASVTSGTMVTATAAVSAGTAPLTVGQVNFCDASAMILGGVATTCDPLHLIGSAQLTSAGTAVLRFVPGPGNRIYRAFFAGTATNATSASTTSLLTVAGSAPSTTTISQSGVPGNYSLNATVAGKGPFAPAGALSFLDTSNGNATVARTALVASASTYSATAAQTAAVGTYPESSATADFNGDGIPDLAVANSGSANVSILLGKGDGTFNPATALTTASVSSFVAVGDFNRDGKADLAVVASNGNNGITIFLGNGDGTFTAAPTVAPAPSYSVGLAVADFNGDGLQDLAVISQNSSTVTILLGNGDGTFTPGVSLLTGSSPRVVVTADLNADGIADLAICGVNSNAVTVLLGNGDGTFSSAPSPAVAYPVSLAVGDLNRDGKLDLIVGSEYTTTAVLLPGNGDGTFGTSSTVTVGSYPWALAVADFNGDGKPDLAVANYYSSSAAVVLGNGDGTFAAPTTVATGSDPGSLSIGDFNGDGVPDVAVANYYGNSVTVIASSLAQKSSASVTGVSPLGTGQHAIAASFQGDSVFGGSSSATTNLTAGSGPPAVTVSLSARTATIAQPLTITVNVSGGSSNPVPTGSVLLSSGNYASAAVPLSAGSAMIAIPGFTLPSGIDTLSIAYTPDAAGSALYTTATGSASVTITKVTPSVNATLSASSITTAQPLSVTVAVTTATGGGNPTGSVAISSGVYTSSAFALSSSGSAVVTIPAGALAAGSDTLAITYTPDTAGTVLYNSASGSASVNVGITTPAVTLSLSGSSIMVLQPLTVMLGVNSGVTGSVPTGTVLLSSGSYASASTPLTNGSATIVVTGGSLAAGTDVLSATYTPDASGAGLYNAASGSGSVTVAKVTPSETLSLSASSVTTAQPLTVTVALKSGFANATPTGSVVLSNGSYTSAATALSNGSAAITVPAGSLPIGTDALQAVYTPDAGSAPTYLAVSGTTSVAVTAAVGSSTATISVAPSLTTITNLMTNTVAVTISGVSGQVAPTGTITLSSGTYSAQVTLANGAASFAIAAGMLAAGADTLTAVYSGDPVYASRSGTAAVTVAPVLITASTMAAITAGATGSSTITLTAGSGYSGTMNLSCTLTSSPAGAQSLPACRFASSSLALASAGSANTTLSVSTTAASHAALEVPAGMKHRGYLYGAPVMAAVLFLLLPSRRRRFAIFLFLLGTFAAALTGCAGGSSQSSGGGNTTTTPATTAGNYTFTVTATDNSSGTSISSVVAAAVQ